MSPARGPRRTGVLVVGASAAGLATVEALRREGYTDPITLLGGEYHLPYDRPPLSKQVLSGTWRPEQTLLRPPRQLTAYDCDFVLGKPALALDLASRTVSTATGDFTADHVVLATGATPRLFPGTEGITGVHVLRTLDDALALRDALRTARRVVVVGEGVLGAEIAATARRSGLDVTLTGPQSAPMAAQLGPLAAERLAALHTGEGVRLRLGVGVRGCTTHDGAVTVVVLEDSHELPADLVVVAIGAIPMTDWLTDSGLTLDNGIVCDAQGRTAPGVYAAGDVARWHHPALGTAIRLENRTSATLQAGVVAATITGSTRAHQPIPYFWTDQFDAKIQVHGLITADANAQVVEGDPADGRFVLAFDRAGVPAAILGWNMPKQVAAYRRALVEVYSPAPVPAP
ncbi:NAD(P)/FAD-dependent oxidoreductase [Nocardia sp. NPDC003693]